MSLALTEEQIHRYSRQILLREVGGGGQEKFLSQSVALAGQGASQATAAAYLAASGMGLRMAKREVLAGEEGFLFTSSQVGRGLKMTLQEAAEEMNPDALRSRLGAWGTLGELPATFEGPAPWVAVGRRERSMALVFRAAGGCIDCFQRAIAGLEPGADEGGSIYLGALAALAFERLVLGLGPDLGGFWVERDGAMSAMEVKLCLLCR
jgi:molybdopterin-synthase adenylyltransferase